MVLTLAPALVAPRHGDSLFPKSPVIVFPAGPDANCAGQGDRSEHRADTRKIQNSEQNASGTLPLCRIIDALFDPRAVLKSSA